jgi:phosphoribosyl 1,2-cyclic phosphodiesterase
MSLRVCVLASGSKANALFLRSGETRVLVDVGLGIRNLTAAFQTIREPLHLLDAIFITHEHTDHIRGLDKLLDKFRIPVFASEGTLRCVERVIPAKCAVTALLHDEVELGAFAVKPLPVPHDAAEPLAYSFLVGTQRVTVATDLGEVPRAVASALAHSTVAVFESNHDVELLKAGSYPPILKARILSNTGHLSNEQSATALRHARGNGLQHVVLAHISAENNHPGIALKTAMEAVDGERTRVHLTRQVTLGPLIEV